MEKTVSNYIHNNESTATANLRLDLDNAVLHETVLNTFMSFYVIVFEDKAGAQWDEKWRHTKTYCGVIEHPRDSLSFREGVLKIMSNGAKPHQLGDFMLAQKIHSK